MAKNDFAVLVVDVSAENRRFEDTRDMAAAFVLRKLMHHSTKSQICLILLGVPGDLPPFLFSPKYCQGGRSKHAAPFRLLARLRFSVASWAVVQHDP